MAAFTLSANCFTLAVPIWSAAGVAIICGSQAWKASSSTSTQSRGSAYSAGVHVSRGTAYFGATQLTDICVYCYILLPVWLLLPQNVTDLEMLQVLAGAHRQACSHPCYHPHLAWLH